MNRTKLPAIALLLAATALCALSGCLGPHIAIPPGELASWEHIGSFGPWQSHIVMHGVVKQADGTFRVQDYSGSATWLGIGPHDVIQGLVINPAPATK